MLSSSGFSNSTIYGNPYSKNVARVKTKKRSDERKTQTFKRNMSNLGMTPNFQTTKFQTSVWTSMPMMGGAGPTLALYIYTNGLPLEALRPNKI